MIIYELEWWSLEMIKLIIQDIRIPKIKKIRDQNKYSTLTIKEKIKIGNDKIVIITNFFCLPKTLNKKGTRNK